MKKIISMLVVILLLAASAMSLVACTGTNPGITDNTGGGTGGNGAGDNGTCSHRDDDNNGSCDDCSASVIVIFNLFGINDLHGKLSDSDSQPGVDEMTTYLMNARAENPNTVIFSSGDMWQGTAESGLTYGKIMTEWMNYLDFEFMTIGNHEFDWGGEHISENLELAEFPFLAINIYDSETNEQADFCQSSVIVDLGEVQIGFIGAIGDCYSSISSDMSAGYYFKTGNQLTQLIKNESDALRTQGADFIVLSLHSDSEDYDSSLSSGGYIDIVFEGHTHQRYVEKDSWGIYHLQGGGDNRNGLSCAVVSYNFVSGSHTVTAAKTVYHSEMASSEPSDIVDELWNEYSEQTSKVNQILGNNREYLDANSLRVLISELYASLATTEWSEYDVVLGGGYLSCRSPGYLSSGSVTYGDLYMLFPFNNRLALCSLSGQTLLNRYVNNTSYFMTYTEYGLSVKDNIDPDATYYIIADSYNYNYAPNRLTVVEYYDEGVYARDLMAEYIKEGGLGDNTQGGGAEALVPDRYYTFAELTEYGKTLSDNADTGDDKYYSSGTVVEIQNMTYGNMLLSDGEGNTFFVFGLYSEDGATRFDAMENPPRVGDTVTLYGKIKKYVSYQGTVTVEFVSARLISVGFDDG